MMGKRDEFSNLRRRKTPPTAPISGQVFGEVKFVHVTFRYKHANNAHFENHNILIYYGILITIIKSSKDLMILLTKSNV